MILRLAAAGHTTHDRYGPDLLPGGSAWYAARTWHALGARAQLITTVGADFALDPSQPFAGLDLCLTRAGRTTTFTNTYTPAGDRHQHLAARAPATHPPATHDPPPDALFLAPVLGELDLTAWRAHPARLRAAGLQGWLKRAAPDGQITQHPDHLDPPDLAGLHAVFLSDEDLGPADPRTRRRFLTALRATVPLVALTHGARGSTLYTPASTWHIGTLPCPPLDPTGAGDTYAAGTLHALAAGADPPTAARLGAALAAAVIQHRGGAPAQALIAAAAAAGIPTRRLP